MAAAVGRGVARDRLVATDSHVSYELRLPLPHAIHGFTNNMPLEVDARGNDAHLVTRLDSRLFPGFDRPAFTGLGGHVLRCQRHDPLFLVNADFHAILKLNDKLVQLCMGAFMPPPQRMLEIYG